MMLSLCKRGETLEKLRRLRDQFDEQQIDAILITNPVNRRYITNFTGSSGIALITKKEQFLITDFRYVEQAKKQAEHFTIVRHERAIEDEIARLLNTLQLERLGFEEEYVTYSQYRTYENLFSIRLVPVKNMIESLRLIKTNEEIQTIKRAAKIADLAFNHILNYIKAGVTELDIATELEYFMRKQGATSSSFTTIVASGWRSALPHGNASNKKIQEGELVTLDFGAIYEGYVSDMTRTVAVGKISEELTKIYNIVKEAQQRGLDGIKAKMTGKEADALTREYIQEKGYGEYFGHSTGHGIGLEVHEGPTLSPRSETILEKNMVVTVEPGIYVPGVGGCRIEDDIVITEDGNERLTFSTKDLIHL